MKRHLCAIAAALVVVLICSSLVTAAPPLPDDKMTIRTLGRPGPNWIYVLDMSLTGAVTKVNIIDGDSMRVLGQLNGGILSNLTIAPDLRELYMIDTYYSRGWRGKRTDVVTILDARKLTYLAEVVIPSKRLLIVPKRNATGITPDGRFLLISNMTPATSVSVVDLKSRRFVAEINTPGCTQVFVGGNRRFSTVCGDGALLNIRLDQDGKEAGRRRSKPLFNPDKDPMFDQPAVAGGKAWFVSYHGQVLEVNLSGTEARVEARWSLLSAADKAGKWRPGGWQTTAVSDGGPKRLFVLMHQGGEWTHKQTGKEIWMFDLARRRRLRRIKLKTEGYSIFAGPGREPMIFSASLLKGVLETYSSSTGRFLNTIKDLGAPILLYGAPFRQPRTVRSMGPIERRRRGMLR